jgi:tetratricopeptide (TPR) repeat protein
MKRAAALFLAVLALGSGALSLSRVDPADLPAAIERVFDQRTDGERLVGSAQSRLAAAPNDAKALAGLASAYLVRARETADPTYYAKADALLGRAVAAAPGEPDVLIAAGSLALSRHDFTAALDYGLRATTAAPFRPAAYGVLTDALVELGRYDDAVAAAQRMVDLRPDLASLTRVSYIRELHGDLPGALDAMRRALEAGAPRGEAAAFTEAHVGDLLFAMGDLDGADRAFEGSTRRLDAYPYGIAGRARVLAARGDLPAAAALYEDAARRLPLPDVVIALGDVYARLGDTAKAEQQYALVAAMEKLLASNGVRVDVDLALFDLDHDRDLAGALAAARAEYAVRPSTPVAMTLAWAEYKNGLVTDAQRHVAEALRLGWRDPRALERAAVISGVSAR